MKKTIEVNNELKKEMIEKIMGYFTEERGEKIGNLAATLLLNFFLEEIAPEIYNVGVYDSYRYLNERLEDVLTIQK